MFFVPCPPGVNPFASRYLLNGNVLAARTFITHFTSSAGKTLGLASGHPSVAVGSDEVVLTKDPVLNFAQMAVLTCQRANGDTNKVVRESWIRLCGTYQSRGGVLAHPEVRKVCLYPFLVSRLSKLAQVLHEIGTLYFALPQPRGQPANPFGDMLSSLFGGGGSGTAAPRVLTPGQAASTGLD